MFMAATKFVPSNVGSFVILLMLMSTCQSNHKKDGPAEQVDPPVKITRTVYGNTPEGPADLFTLTNGKGVVIEITNYGGIIVSWLAPDRNGKMEDVVLGFDNIDGYLAEHPYFGAIVGRYGNRINDGQFALDGQTYSLAKNNNGEHLHGGDQGFDKRLWKAEIVGSSTPSLQLTRTSLHMEEGYPGNLQVVVTYTLDSDHTLTIDYRAETDQETVLNLTNHSYFNLRGQGNGDILQHTLTLYSDHFTPVDTGLIPTGVLEPVTDTPFDFRRETLIGEHIEADHVQLKRGRGFDHNFVVRRDAAGSDEHLMPIASVHEPMSGRTLEIESTEPGVQFYTGNFLDGTLVGKDGKIYGHRAGFCLETQHFPDSPNQPQFPSVKLKPGEIFHSITRYKFSTR